MMPKEPRSMREPRVIPDEAELQWTCFRQENSSTGHRLSNIVEFVLIFLGVIRVLWCVTGMSLFLGGACRVPQR